ncbi:HET-domain-containing protein [Macroventuria anomochaeta]|uniref:HET-domain-containing protein n=1 Tax=Macroventuria anomochaeta TaxID=301207 RepID=A0ACB6RLD6_9PLEO|nr:HET-domain-containing protein [Macroventuria anomochaeta]KAF2622210.1 HET-domain-containing protein [Macroventuria anomochaeta]
MSVIYKPLDPSKHEIRLLRISPANRRVFPRTIDCTLETISLDDRTIAQYIALSYMWGPAPQPENASSWPDVYVDGELVNVTANLNLALIHFSLRCTQDVHFWIDAICINQKEPVEKGHQVGLMRRVYASAHEVWAWQIPLQSCKLAMNFLTEASSHMAEENRGDDPRSSVSTVWLRQQLENAELRTTWEGLTQLLSQPYWRRNWIIQELTVNEHVHIVCGFQTAPLELLINVLDGLIALTLSGVFSTVNANIQASAYDCGQILLLKSRGPDTLDALLRRFTNCNASDPRDKIYSLVGIAAPYPNVELRPDYNVEWPEVFYKATKYIIQGSRNLDILASSASGTNELPSWVPDFAKQSPLRLGTNDKERTPAPFPSSDYFNAGGRSFPVALFSDDCTRLTVHAMFVHNLSYIIPQRQLDSRLAPIEELRRRLQFLVILFLESARAPGSRELPEEPVVTELCAYVCLRFYEATMLTSNLSDLVQQVWSATDFVQFCLKVIPGGGRETDCTPEQLDILQTALSPFRSLICCELKAPFSLVEDFQATAMNSSHVHSRTITTLRQCRFLMPGYCRNREEWGWHGDVIAIVLGCNVPLILRPVSRPGELPTVMRIVSEAYVQGIMHGQALNKYPVQQITLV